MKRRIADDPGVALLVAVLTTLLISALAAAVVLTTSSESLIGVGFRTAQQALYSAEAAAEWSVADLAAPGADWASIAAGTTRSAFVDGLPSGLRTIGDGTVDLGAIAAAYSEWHPYAWGRLDDLLPVGNRVSQSYVMVFAAPDGSGADRLKVRALALGPRGAHSVVEIAALKRSTGVRVDSWLESR